MHESSQTNANKIGHESSQTQTNTNKIGHESSQTKANKITCNEETANRQPLARTKSDLEAADKAQPQRHTRRISKSTEIVNINYFEINRSASNRAKDESSRGSSIFKLDLIWKIEFSELKFTGRVLGKGFFGEVLEGKDDWSYSRNLFICLFIYFLFF